MCIIAVSKKGVRQPNTEELKTMFQRNPDGAGYMFLNKNGDVEIHKGFMTWEDFEQAMKVQKFTKDDVVIYHFRIATQGGINREMCHPFPLTDKLEQTTFLDCVGPCGVAHNGIIPITTDRRNKNYSDTALFIVRYLSQMITGPGTLTDRAVLDEVERLARSKFAILDKYGNIATIGDFIEDDGILYSNATYRKITYRNVNFFGREYCF